jgi:hypothetical protein
MIQLTEAFWGRDDATVCPGPNQQVTTCTSEVPQDMQDACNGAQECTISPCFQSLGDPCGGVLK